MFNDPLAYEAWYHTPKGKWAGKRELSLLMELLPPVNENTLLDVGSGTGYFSRKFANKGLTVSGLEAKLEMIQFARTRATNINFIKGDAKCLPFKNNSFDYCSAITSLCFINEPVKALAEMWRVSRYGVILGLLNRNSLLYQKKNGKGGYLGARWDSWKQVKNWLTILQPYPEKINYKTTLLFPGGRGLDKFVEPLLPGNLLIGGFLGVYLGKPQR